MTTRLQIQWPNADSELLFDRTITVEIDGNEATPLSDAPGTVIYDIPEGSSSVDLTAVFMGGQLTSIPVLTAHQSYLVSGAGLYIDKSKVVIDADGSITFPTVSPLIDSVSSANVSGLTLAEIRTEFVLAQVFNEQNAAGSWWVEADRNPLVNLVALASTSPSVGPPIWITNFHTRMAFTQSNLISTLVFFRPAAHYSYKSATDPANRRALGDLSRFVMSQKASLPFIDQQQWDRFGFIALRCGFQDALQNSPKDVLMVHPWPTGGTDFGQAATSKLPAILTSIIRFLRGMGLLAVNQAMSPGDAPVQLGRLGISGYSAGSEALFTTLNRNKGVVKELYIFDCMTAHRHTAEVVAWARNTPTFRLRMTNAWFFAPLFTIFKAITRSPIALNGQVSISPENPLEFWGPAEDGGSPWWDYVTTLNQSARKDGHFWHQFAIFGGNSFTPPLAEEFPARGVTFLEEFLTNSLF